MSELNAAGAKWDIENTPKYTRLIQNMTPRGVYEVKTLPEGSDFPCSRCSTSFTLICLFYEVRVHVHKLLSTANLVYSKFFPTNDPRKSTLVRYQHLITVDMPQNSSIPGKTSKPEEMGNRNGVWFTTPYSKIDCKKILFLLECFWSWYLRCSKLILSNIHKSQ